MPPEERTSITDQNRQPPVEATSRIAGEVQPDAPMPKPQQQLLDAWRGLSEQIVAYNSRQGGGHLQNSVYRYASETLRDMGLDRQGWEVLPAQTGSALDMIGADIILVNRRTGALELLDPSSRRLDPQTGDFASAADNAKTNVPRLRENGVIDALPQWFDQSGRLEKDQRTPEMSQRVIEFQADFRNKIASLTAPGAEHALNMRDFPLPTPTISKEKDKPAADIKRVVDFFNQRAGEENRSGSRGLAAEFSEYARTLERGAATFAARQDSVSLENTVNKLAERVILEDAVRSLYPQPGQQHLTGAQISMRQTSSDGTIVQVKPDGALTVMLKNQANPGSGAPEVYTGGSATKAFEKAATKLALAAGHPEQFPELAAELPNHYKKMFAAGTLDMNKVLKVIGNFRAEYSAGGAGTDRTLIGHLVHRLAERQPGDLRTLATGINGAKPTASAGHDGATTTVRPTTVTQSDRQAANDSRAPNVQGRGQHREEFREAAAQASTQPQERWGNRKPPELAELGSQGSDKVSPQHLSPQELTALKEAREQLIAKGNLSPSEKQQVKNIEQAERELGESSPVTRQKLSRVAAVRSAIAGRGLVRSAGPAMLAAVVLNLYRNANATELEEGRPNFGLGW